MSYCLFLLLAFNFVNKLLGLFLSKGELSCHGDTQTMIFIELEKGDKWYQVLKQVASKHQL